MSVLLDALKKAAEEKKNAENGIQETVVAETNAPDSSVAEEPSSPDAGLKLTIEEPIVEPESATNQVNESDVIGSQESSELPVFNLQENLEANADNDSSMESDTTELKLEPMETGETQSSLEINDEPAPSSPQDLTSLIDSLDLGEDTPAENIRLESKQEQSLENALSVEQQHQPDLEPLSIEPVEISAEQGSAIQPEPSTGEKDEFQWSMDELPGYSGDVSAKKMDATTPLEQNPILIKGDNTPQKSNSRYATSSKVIVSLFVVLLFIGIGFYGLLYYQEQNEALERSMKQYNISKIQLVSPKPETKQNAPVVEENSDVLSLNVVKNQSKEIETKLENTEAVKNQSVADLVEELPASTALESIESRKQAYADNKKTTAKVTGQEKSISTSKSNASASKQSLVRKERPSVKGVESTVSKKVSPKTAIVKVTKKPALVREAYAAYNNGKFSLAKQKFSQILSSDPQSVTALLGLGGVAVASGKHYEAIAYYQRILDSDPNNLTAFESIANLSGRVPLNKAWEDELFRMAEDYPKSSTLQYAKGNVHAKNKDWLAAQENYFNALVLDSSNPDYMVNLAVSYDHLGKYKLASQYYTQALAFANRKHVSFNENQVRDRLISIRQFIVKGP